MSRLGKVALLAALVASVGSAAQAGEVVIFRDGPPAADDLADIMFPERGSAPAKPKMRGIRFTLDEKAATPSEPEGLAPSGRVAAADESTDQAGQAKGDVVGFNIQFAFGSAEILGDARPYLASIGEMMNLERMRNRRLLIAGHADAAGERDFNFRLSKMRALAVRDYLAANYAIAVDRLAVEGYGETQPLPGTNPYDGINRRVEFHPLK